MNNFTGVFALTINGTDSGGLSDTVSFEINVSAVNDNPWSTIGGDALSNVTINEDAGAVTVATAAAG